MLARLVNFNAFGWFCILKKNLTVYKDDKQWSREYRCFCVSYVVCFLELREIFQALKYSKSEFELLSEVIS